MKNSRKVEPGIVYCLFASWKG